MDNFGLVGVVAVVGLVAIVAIVCRSAFRAEASRSGLRIEVDPGSGNQRALRRSEKKPQ